MEELDLNIDNYSLDDILKLFKLDINFDKEDMINAKKIVLQVHPDKSRLDKEYFLFFKKAYGLLYKVYNFKFSYDNKDIEGEKDYDTEIMDENQDENTIWENLSKDKNFNSIFNEMFEKNYSLKDDGYEEWLKNNDEDIETARNIDEVNFKIKEKKKNLREMINYQDIESVKSVFGSSLIQENGNYGSDMFGKLKYDDLKTVYTESVIPVTEEDFINKKKFTSIDEFNRYRDKNLREVRESSNHKKIEIENQEIEHQSNLMRAYELAKEENEMKKVKNNMASTLQRLT
tara:strand:+ start:30 stop:893 length:864 start_codon:yes stop_codon:yes gene_type:complete